MMMLLVVAADRPAILLCCGAPGSDLGFEYRCRRTRGGPGHSMTFGLPVSFRHPLIRSAVYHGATWWIAPGSIERWRRSPTHGGR